ncbi:ParA family protein [Desulfovibrio inopinatus]|uniref:ParA family protein n=1 Tax=Desulfovibrio inopinatus TaxID=102109 RepID=UPI000401CC18|nr:ParA family protein [Desulfovibrio inopinatus]
MSYIIAIVNNKGGVGKTTLAANVSHALANRGSKCLVVDLDSQCNLTSTLLDMAKTPVTLYELIDEEENPPFNDIVYTTYYERLFMIPNVPETAALEPSLMEKRNRFSLLRDRLRDNALQNFDFTFIDCPPNLGTFSVMAMIAADFVIVPVEGGSRYALDGLDKTVAAIETIRQGYNTDLRFLRLLITKVDRRTTISKILIEQVQNRYKDKLFETIIPVNTDIQQAELMGRTVIRYSPRSLGAKCFRDLAKELETILE